MSPEAEAAPGLPDYARTSLIAYLGNKRAMLPRLQALFKELEEASPPPSPSFLDPFAGSGSVARLARSLGYRVMAGDLEEYAYWVNLAWLGVGAEEEPGLFREEGGLSAVLGLLNRLHPEREDEDFPAEPYIARHYAPASTPLADHRRERLFYTRENATFLDRARAAIDALRPLPAFLPEAEPPPRELRERALLLGPLVYQAATHSNTSGVFKAFHKGFGGHGRDALGRILAPMRLEAPLLWPGPPAEVGQSGAAAFAAARPAWLCYLDPPYNQHQYGSNYHLLNSLTRQGRREIPEARDEEGRLLATSGIPADWKASRSDFCSRARAGEAFRELLGAVDARLIVLSYNDEGLVSREELYDLLSDRAEVEIRAEPYVRYRGGRQSAGRRIRNHELIFIARRREGSLRGDSLRGDRARGKGDRARGEGDRARAAVLGELEANLRLAAALAGTPSPGRIEAACPECSAPAGTELEGSEGRGPGREGLAGTELEGALLRRRGELLYRGPRGEFSLGRYRSLAFEAPPGLEGLTAEEKEDLAAHLEPLLARDNAEACAEALGLLESALETRAAPVPGIQRLALAWLRKLAHPRYREAFDGLYARASALAAGEGPGLRPLREGLARLGAQAGLRMGWRPPPGPDELGAERRRAL